MSVKRTPEEAPWQAGLHGAQALFRPGLVLQAVALGLVLAYYFLPAARGFFERLAVWRTEGGFVFSAVAGALCGGVVPFFYLRMNPATRAANPWPLVLFFAFFWAWKGAETDLWYRIMSAVFGDGTGAATIAVKAASDQFLWNSLYAAPVGIAIFAWKDAGFRWAPVAADRRAGRWYYRRVFPVLLTTWAVWIPVVCCVYALPPALQVPLFNVVLCFWSLLFTHLMTRQRQGKNG
jgi:hypothetical protein